MTPENCSGEGPKNKQFWFIYFGKLLFPQRFSISSVAFWRNFGCGPCQDMISMYKLLTHCGIIELVGPSWPLAGVWARRCHESSRCRIDSQLSWINLWMVQQTSTRGFCLSQYLSVPVSRSMNAPDCILNEDRRTQLDAIDKHNEKFTFSWPLMRYIHSTQQQV